MTLHQETFFEVLIIRQWNSCLDPSLSHDDDDDDGDDDDDDDGHDGDDDDDDDDDDGDDDDDDDDDDGDDDAISVPPTGDWMHWSEQITDNKSSTGEYFSEFTACCCTTLYK